ncbi:MAG: dihydropteroate synthase family protein [Magnetococcales bacterium]|nr:dihydropteroate synthase family protein [Magnetococcales bacterium]
MGILNVTPDSFSDGGRLESVDEAVAQGVALAEAGADILDVGGESTRPGATPVSLEQECQRVLPVVEALAQRVKIPISVDTSKAGVMKKALAVGAGMINDVTALGGGMNTGDSTGPSSNRDGINPEALELLAATDHPIILMHMGGTPATMQEAPHYQDVVVEVFEFLEERITLCQKHGIDPKRLIADPGIGFGKSTQHNLTLLRHLPVLKGLGVPLLLGVSRKRVVGALTGEAKPEKRDVGSHVLAALGALWGGADMVRVHDVAGTRQALDTALGWSEGLEAAA